jgi:hypothetical protein
MRLKVIKIKCSLLLILELKARNRSVFAQIILGMIKYDQNLRTNLSEVIQNLNSVVI